MGIRRRPTERPSDSSGGAWRLAGEPVGDGVVGQVAGGDDVRQRGSAELAGAAALGEVDLDEVAMGAGEFGERIERFDDARAARPAAADAAGQRHHGDAAFAQELARPASSWPAW